MNTSLFDAILVVVSAHEASLRAVDLASSIAARDQSRLELLYVLDEPLPYDENGAPLLAADNVGVAAGTRILETARDRAAERDLSPQLQLVGSGGDPGTAIANEARRWGADLIVVGVTSHHRLLSTIFGSTTAAAVVTLASTAVLSVP